MVTEHCARLTVEGPSRRGSRVVVVTDPKASRVVLEAMFVLFFRVFVQVSGKAVHEIRTDCLFVPILFLIGRRACYPCPT